MGLLSPFFMAYLFHGEKRKVVLFNGPRHSGKDTAAAQCVKTFGAHHFKFSAPIKAAIKAAFSLSDADVDYLESIKTEPTPILMGKSYVDTQISFSEDWVKTLWGVKAFGFLAVRHLQGAIAESPSQGLYISSDSGFAQEAEPVINLFGPKNVLLVKLVRDGKTFEGDSRSYIHLPGVATVTLLNDDIQSYRQRVDDLVGSFLAGEPSPF
jgi:hypothetical protein